MEKTILDDGKNKRAFWLKVLVYLFFLYGIHIFVFMNGDDFMYGSFAHDGILKNVWSYYHTGNGRLWINVLDSALLFFDRYLYIILNPLFIIFFIWLLTKNVQWITGQHYDKSNERMCFLRGIVLFTCLDVMCLRETVFWITGMMNYLFPAIIFLLALLLFQYSRVRLIPRKYVFLYWILCFLAGSSVEQFALMFVGVITLMFAIDIVQKRTISHQNRIAYALAIIGLACLILAPGNFVRIDAQHEIKPPLIDNLWTLVYQNSFSEVAFPFILMISLCSTMLELTVYTTKCTYKRILQISMPILLLFVRSIPELEKAIVITIVLLLFSVQIIRTFILRKYPGKRILLSLLFVGIGSQVMLLVSAIWGFRCMFSMYLIDILMISCTLPQLSERERIFILCSGLTAALHPIATIIYWALTLLLWACKQRSHFKKISVSIIHLGTVLSLSILLVGYANNTSTHHQNLRNTTAENTDTIYLSQLPDETYSWYFIPFGEFHEQYYRLYHQIPDNTTIEYITIEEGGNE
ncbi:MAG: hypothetical protein HPZ79_06730 [Oscillospiraceae bacterium]|nr:hypothetical protein [Oscillospiraceae bacterium]